MTKQSETSRMKHFTKILALLLLSLFIANASPAQSMLKKANKEFELYAFNLATKSYRKVLEKDPNNVEALARLADCYRHLNQMEEAATWYARALDREGVDPVNLFYYGQVLKSLGKYAEAKEFFEIYGEGQPYFGEHYAASCDFAQSMLGVPSLYRVKREFINTPNSEFGPTFFKERVVYSSSRNDIARADHGKGETWTGSAKNQLFISGRDNNGFLTPPQLVRSDLANTYNEGPLSYSADGKMVAYTKNDFVDGTRQIPTSGMELSIYLAKVNPDGDFYEAKPFPYNGSGYSSGFPSLSADGKTMYFSSNRPDGLGGWDIYVSRRIGETWTTPENLGAVVNTAGNELSPCFDGNSLYFSSDWHHGMGGLDIFRAERVKQEWTKVFHLGNGVNSPRDDFGFIFRSDMNLGYFTSNRSGGKGNEDLYQVTKRTDQITISVRDAADQPIAAANIDFSACNEPVFQTDANGNYQFQALGGLDCEAIISKAGFTSYALKVEASGARQSQNYDVVLAKEIEKLKGMVINVNDNTPVGEVYVRATNQESGQVLETNTDASGSYSLALLPQSVYVIRYSKAGFTDTHNRVKVDNGSDRGVLGILSFSPSTTQIDPTPVVNTGGNTGGGTSTTPTDTEAELNTEGYSIQLAALYGNEKINTDSYRILKDIGNLYSRKDKGYMKLRVGIFETKAEADQAKANIEAKGFKNVFITSEKLENMDDVEVHSYTTFGGSSTTSSTTPKEETVASTPKETTPPTETTPKAETTNTGGSGTTAPPTGGTAEEKGRYKIRLATYQNTKYFDASKVEGFGTVEQVKKGKLTIMILSAFDSLAEVNQVFEKVKASGFKGAHIITERDGQWIRVR